jgi:cytidylate kinase
MITGQPDPVIGIDGPNGVGKTAVARCLARERGWRWLSVGMVYRALAAADGGLDAGLRLRGQLAADGVVDPVIEVAGIRFTEPDLVGRELGSAAVTIAREPCWQHKVNAELRRYAEDGLVVEGRATQEIFPGAAMNVYLWADRAQRARRAAAVTGAPNDAERDRRDAEGTSETLRVRRGAVVWDSTRYSLEQTVSGLLRRSRLLTGAEPAVVALAGDPLAADGPADGRYPGHPGFRVVPASTAAGPVDAVMLLPPGLPAASRACLIAAHLQVLLAGNDLVSIGGVEAGGEPAVTQRMLEAVLWPPGCWLRSGWLLRHGHFAVSGDVLDLAAASAGITGPSAAVAAITDPPAALLAALQDCRWVPNPAAVAPGPAQRAGPPAQSPSGPDLDALLASLQDPAAAPGPDRVDLRDCADPRAALWVLAAAPGRTLAVSAWPERPARAAPATAAGSAAVARSQGGVIRQQVFSLVDGGRCLVVVDRPLAGQAAATVILAHGLTGDRSGPAELLSGLSARLCAAAGVRVVRFDFRGSGDSGGEFGQTTFAGMTRAFAEIATRHAEPGRPVICAGISIGGVPAAVAACQLRREGPLDVAGVVLMSSDLIQGVRFGVAGLTAIRGGEFHLPQAFFRERERLYPRTLLSESGLPFLLIYGREDAKVAAETRWFAAHGEVAELDSDHLFESSQARCALLGAWLKYLGPLLDSHMNGDGT